MGEGDLFMLSKLAAVGATHHPGAGFVFAKHFLHGVSYFTNRASEEKTADGFWALEYLL